MSEYNSLIASIGSIIMFIIFWSITNMGLIIFLKIHNNIQERQLNMIRLETCTIFTSWYDIWCRDDDKFKGDFVVSVVNVKNTSYIEPFILIFTGLVLAFLPVSLTIINLCRSIENKNLTTSFLFFISLVLITILLFNSTRPIYKLWRITK